MTVHHSVAPPAEKRRHHMPLDQRQSKRSPRALLSGLHKEAFRHWPTRPVFVPWAMAPVLAKTSKQQGRNLGGFMPRDVKGHVKTSPGLKTRPQEDVRTCLSVARYLGTSTCTRKCRTCCCTVVSEAYTGCRVLHPCQALCEANKGKQVRLRDQNCGMRDKRTTRE